MLGFDKLPDNTNKIYLALSVIAFYFLVTAYKIEQDKLDASHIEYSKVSNEQNSGAIEASDKLIRLVRTSEYISKKYNVTNPVSWTDSTASLEIRSDTSKNYSVAVDIILPIYLDYTSSYLKNKIHRIILKGEDKKLNLSKSYFKEKAIFYGVLTLMALFIFLSSINSLRKKEDELESLESFKRFMEKYSLREKGKLKETCQSCGRIFDSIVTVSKNSDGTFNYSFCSECFYYGNFVMNYDDVTLLLMSNDVIPAEKKQLYLDQINKLDRWKKNRYAEPK